MKRYNKEVKEMKLTKQEKILAKVLYDTRQEVKKLYDTDNTREVVALSIFYRLTNKILDTGLVTDKARFERISILGINYL